MEEKPATDGARLSNVESSSPKPERPVSLTGRAWEIVLGSSGA